jgi:hypothetical protein
LEINTIGFPPEKNIDVFKPRPRSPAGKDKGQRIKDKGQSKVITKGFTLVAPRCLAGCGQPPAGNTVGRDKGCHSGKDKGCLVARTKPACRPLD